MSNPKTLSKEFIDKWEYLLNEVEMDDIPLDYIERLELFFNDGKPPAFIDITSLLQDQKSWKLEQTINKELDKIEDILERVDSHLNLEKVVETIDTATSETLKDL